MAVGCRVEQAKGSKGGAPGSGSGCGWMAWNGARKQKRELGAEGAGRRRDRFEVSGVSCPAISALELRGTSRRETEGNVIGKS